MEWITRISRAAMMGLAWAAVWVPVGALVGRIIVGEVEPEHIGGSLIPSFFCGAIFSAATGIAAGRRTLAGLSLSLAGIRGALSGLLGSGLWLVVLFGGFPSEPRHWVLSAGWFGALTLASAISGVGSALVARLLSNSASANAA